jgi:hypothetical protein
MFAHLYYMDVILLMYHELEEVEVFVYTLLITYNIVFLICKVVLLHLSMLQFKYVLMVMLLFSLLFIDCHQQ